jgi:hypothetical protein
MPEVTDAEIVYKIEKIAADMLTDTYSCRIRAGAISRLCGKLNAQMG